MAKIYTVTIEVFDDTTYDQLENVIDNSLCDAGFDCVFEVKEDEPAKDDLEIT